MKNWIVRASATLALVTVAAGIAVAAPPKETTKTVATPCPVCKMPLTTKMTKDNSVAVKLTPKGKTMYCCSKCKMPASVLVKPKMKK